MPETRFEPVPGSDFNGLLLMKKGVVVVCLLFGMLSVSLAQEVFRKQTVHMGSAFSFVVVADSAAEAAVYFQRLSAEMERIENLISEWRSHTQIAQVNQNAGIAPVKVDREVFDLTQRAIRYAELTGGAFDISIAALDRIWVFDGSMTELPSEDLIRRSIERVGYQHIRLDSLNSTIFLEKEGMKIGFGSIGKGYAADQGRALLQSLGVKGGIVNASGDLSTWGRQPDGEPWKIGVSDPFKTYRMKRVLKVYETSVATSGSNEKFAEIGGKRYAHIINPTTGWPSTGLMSVTVWGPSAEFANFLSTSMMVLGKKAGKKLLRQFPEYRADIVKDR